MPLTSPGSPSRLILGTVAKVPGAGLKRFHANRVAQAKTQRILFSGRGFLHSAAKASVIYSALRFFKIFIANGSLISLCLGTVSIAPFFGFIQSECELPSLFR
jgi:hypothetical protein